MSWLGVALMACAGAGGRISDGANEAEQATAWRAATEADVVPGLAEALGHTPELAVFAELGQDLALVRIEVHAASSRARVAVLGGPVLGQLAPAPAGLPAVTSGLWAHAAGALPARDRAPQDLVTFATSHAVVEWCQPPTGQVWRADLACYGSVVAGLEDGVVRIFEVWD